MADSLRSKLIRLAHERPELRADLLPLLDMTKEASAPLDAARAYAEHMKSGPITEMERNGHAHVLRETQTVLQALAALDRLLYGDTQRAYQALTGPLIDFVKVIQVPMGIVPEPAPPKLRLKLKP